MGKYSLIQVFSQNSDSIHGVWLQDFTGNLADALHHARCTEAANSNRINVVVTDKTNSSTPNYALQQIDIRRVHNVF